MSDFPSSHADLLDSDVATLATINADGSPQQTAVWFLHDGGELKLSLNTARLKTKNMQRRPQCSVLLLDLANPYRYLVVRGSARIEPDDDYEFAARLSAKYGGVKFWDHDNPGERRVIVTIVPSNVYARGD
ncbi:MAG: PPOX class F420-dependent oxidoreductase [Thermoleophilaceae bacterium]